MFRVTRQIRFLNTKKNLFFSSSVYSRSLSTITPEDIINDCSNVRTSIQTLNDRFKGPLEKSSQKNTILPFVFLLGNHSSGKSSFINYVTQRKIQTAGVAPTDDSFTIIVPGPSDVDRDGPSFIGDPDMGFSGLRNFGPQLIHQTKLKIRSNIAVQNFMLVDSPGMIDSPMVRENFYQNAPLNSSTVMTTTTSTGQNIKKHSAMERGYDFESVCRWYAERADVILLFFDPDKPGTTGETLSVMTNSLIGLEHKLHIILNKADQFKKIHDFARAYGSLCWNLSKVIQRKDLPRIYTMCLPKNYQVPRGVGVVGLNNNTENEEASDSETSNLSRTLSDLEETREEVVQEVLNAPKRRIDNEITRLNDSIALLQMHLTIVDDLIKQYKKLQFKTNAIFTTSLLTSLSSAASLFYFQAVPLEVAGGVGLSGTLLSFLYYFYKKQSLINYSEDLISDNSMVSTYKRLYARRLAEKDEFIMSLWQRVHDHLILTLTPAELRNMDKIKPADFKMIENILEVDIPQIRRKAAPAFNKKL